MKQNEPWMSLEEIARERANSFLKPEHQVRILAACKTFVDEPGFAKVASTAEILEKDGNLSIPRYVRPVGNSNGNTGDELDLKKTWKSFEADGREFWQEMDELVEMLDKVAQASCL